jgi:hypothetical protein
MHAGVLQTGEHGYWGRRNKKLARVGCVGSEEGRERQEDQDQALQVRYDSREDTRRCGHGLNGFDGSGYRSTQVICRVLVCCSKGIADVAVYVTVVAC